MKTDYLYQVNIGISLNADRSIFQCRMQFGLWQLLIIIFLWLFTSVSCERRKNITGKSKRLYIICSQNGDETLYINISDTLKNSQLSVIKGYPLRIVYNRVPKTASEMLRTLFRDQAKQQDYFIQNKEIFVPFRLEYSVQQEVVQEISFSQLPYFYERHMYFIDFDAYQQPWPVYINIIRDPMDRVLSEYYWSRKICREEDRCYFDSAFLNETLDECVTRRSPSECISSKHGINSMIAFFCGHSEKCENHNEDALNLARQNIIKHYSVIGVLEKLYNFLFVLENLLPRHFKSITLSYMASGRARDETKTQTVGKRLEPSETTKAVLRHVLSREYELYEFVKLRFEELLRQVLLSSV